MRPIIWLASVYLIPGFILPSFALEVTPTPVAAAESHVSKTIKVKKIEFGVFRDDKNGKYTFIPTKKVPLEEGIAYGWQIYLKDYKLKEYKGAVTWREIFRLPKPPESWGTENGEDFSLSKDGKEAITTRTVYVKNGLVKNSWKLAPGDPVGKHTIEVYINDEKIGAFEFDVVPGKKHKKE
ncbi:hypothetical protein [Calothrix sp. 336/3]|uniref:hypothetical protein n=1 Tax=Calothrix sp. 336/3 TaxID=1337936 RepID=UPI0004E3B110|nr:hypothetical protein [Calothrix sp. 336/3]AKG23928.1 hypothetical protein IJ00_23810 [Calothrix sp. 336/3]